MGLLDFFKKIDKETTAHFHNDGVIPNPVGQVEQRQFQTAVQEASKIGLDASFKDLSEIYDNIFHESNVATHYNNQLNKLLCSGIQLIDSDDNPQEDLMKELFNQQTISTLITYCYQTILYGHSVLNFVENGVGEGGKIRKPQAQPRYNVIPNRKALRTMNDQIFYFADPPIIDNTILLVHDENPLGDLVSVAPSVIRLKNILRQIDIHSLKTNGQTFIVTAMGMQKDAFDDLKEQMKNIRINRMLLLQKDVSVQSFDTGATGGDSKIFENQIEYATKQIAKVMSGQTATTEEKSFVGSAEVMERTYNENTKGLMRKIEGLLNDEVIPYLACFYLGGNSIYNKTFIQGDEFMRFSFDKEQENIVINDQMDDQDPEDDAEQSN